YCARTIRIAGALRVFCRSCFGCCRFFSPARWPRRGTDGLNSGVGSYCVTLAETCDAESATRWSAWGGALGGIGTVAGNANAPGLNFNIGGFAAGIDRRFDSFLIGVTAGYSSANQYTQNMPGQGASNTFQASFVRRLFGRQLLSRCPGGLCADRQPND